MAKRRLRGDRGNIDGVECKGRGDIAETDEGAEEQGKCRFPAMQRWRAFLMTR